MWGMGGAGDGWGMGGGVGLPQAPLTCLPSLAPRGKRGWKSFHGILKGMILYLQKVRGQERGGRAGLAEGSRWLEMARPGRGRTRWAPP